MQHNFAIGNPLFIRLSQVDVFAEVEVHIKNNPHTIYHANTSFFVVSFVKFYKLHKHIPTLLYLFISCNHGRFISSFTSYPILLHFIEITCLHKWVSSAPIHQSHLPNKVWLTVPNSHIPNSPLQKERSHDVQIYKMEFITVSTPYKIPFLVRSTYSLLTSTITSIPTIYSLKSYPGNSFVSNQPYTQGF